MKNQKISEEVKDSKGSKIVGAEESEKLQSEGFSIIGVFKKDGVKMYEVVKLGVVVLALLLVGFALGSGATNFDRLVLGSGNYGTDPNSTADITFQNDEYIDNSTNGVLDVGSANITSDGSNTLSLINYGGVTTSAVGTDTYVATLSPALAAYTTGMLVLVKVDTVNTGACTLNLNSLGAKNIKTSSGADPANSDLVAGGASLLVYSDSIFVLLNPATTTD